MCCMFFFFNDTATTEIYTLSLHDALPIYRVHQPRHAVVGAGLVVRVAGGAGEVFEVAGGDDRHRVDVRVRDRREDRKSTRLNSSHANISYAVFCLKKKNKK